MCDLTPEEEKEMDELEKSLWQASKAAEKEDVQVCGDLHGH